MNGPGVVITGSTRGIGRALAGELLRRGCRVVVSGRRQAACDQAAAELAAEHAAAGRVFAQACDVTDYAQVEALWQAAAGRLGRVDIWINNAGLAHPQHPIHVLDPEVARQVVTTNLIGDLYGARVAVRGLLAQGGGALYNLEGLGSDGRRVEGLGVYGATKYAVRYLTQALVAETRGTPVLVGSISPGMVVTELLTGQYRDAAPEEWQRARRAFNLLADRLETVAPWIAGQVLANRKHGARIRWLTPGKILARLALSRIRPRQVVPEESEPGTVNSEL